jgi:uncharacterized protein YbjT (DUF2867 family)
LAKGFPVRAFVRKDDERSKKLQSLGAEIFVGDVLDLRAVRRAFDGVKRAYFVYPMRPGLVEATANGENAVAPSVSHGLGNFDFRNAEKIRKGGNRLP